MRCICSLLEMYSGDQTETFGCCGLKAVSFLT